MRDLDESDVARVIEFARANDIDHVTLGGNEPWFSGLNRSLLPGIIEALLDRGIRASLVTSGPSALRLGAAHPDLFEALVNIAVSFDAPTALEHNSSRGASLWSLALEALRLTSSPRRRPLILWVLRADSTPGQIDTFATVAREYNAYFRINLLKPNSAALEPLYPSPPRVREVMARVEHHFERVLSTDVLLDPKGSQRASCPCGTSTFRIGFKNADGEIPVYACQYHSPNAVAPVVVDASGQALARMYGHSTTVANREHSGCATLREVMGAKPTGRGQNAEQVPKQLQVWLNYLPTWVGELR